ncbi:ABC transporter ATP-binding protein [Halorubrum sp. CSM-61]|uniref:ABC transporter ATP-binding protein n=1 Tax=Halorubrum sp. CSM-61 TaxID=2485838 RepID=UPI000F4B2FB0|nr:ABC transporter ATP-binding protein [Halorubrum sp. CSM-61]
MTEPLLSVRDLKKHYPIRKGVFNRQVGAARAVDGISFDIAPGETLGLVGESGCGKSTAASSVIRLEEPTAGEVVFNGNGREGAARTPDGTHPNDVTRFDDDELKAFRRGAQMIFQDPSSSFDPRMSVGNAVGELLKVHGMSDRHRRRAIVEDLLERVGLSANDFDRYPHEFSGGQKQRIALARALVLNPDLIIADEPVSALDVSIQAEILSLIDDLQEEFGLSLLFISHDMSVIRQICDRVAVMYLGEIVEIGPVEGIFSDPQHPYTEALLSSIPTPDPRASVGGIELKGTVPSPTNPPSGCRFHTRCHKVIQPEGVDVDQDDWRGLLNFRDSVVAGEIDVEQVRENVAAGETAPAESEVRAELRREFDIGETVDDPDLERTLSEAIGLLLQDDDERAGEILSNAITTPCAQTEPARTVHGPDHESACLRHEGRASAEPNPADD